MRGLPETLLPEWGGVLGCLTRGSHAQRSGVISGLKAPPLSLWRAPPGFSENAVFSEAVLLFSGEEALFVYISSLLGCLVGDPITFLMLFLTSLLAFICAADFVGVTTPLEALPFFCGVSINAGTRLNSVLFSGFTLLY